MRPNSWSGLLLGVLIGFGGLVWFGGEVRQETLDSPQVLGVGDDIEVSRMERDERFHVSMQYGKEAYEEVFGQVSGNNIEGVVGGNAPHHLLAAAHMAEFYLTIAGKNTPVVVLVGPDHFNAAKNAVVTSKRSWLTPYGVLNTEADVIEALLSAGLAAEDERVFDKEHSMIVQMPFIKRVFPEAFIVPLVLQPGLTTAEMAVIALRLHQVLPAESLVVSSVDFSHETTVEEAVVQDRETVSHLNAFSYEGIERGKVDSPESLWLLMYYSQLRGGLSLHMLRQADGTDFGATIGDDLTSYVTLVYGK